MPAAWSLAPGFCDLHAHLREPGDAAAETISSGAQAAARGGFTTVCAMPNTEPPLDERGADRLGCRAARGMPRAGYASSAPSASGGPARRSPSSAPWQQSGAVGFSDDGAAVPSPKPRSHGDDDASAALGLPLIEHAEDASLAAAA